MNNTLPLYQSVFDVEYDQWSKLLEDQPEYRIKQVWEGLYRGFTLPHELTSLPKALREILSELSPKALEVVSELKSDNMTTIKWLLGLHDSNQIETVLMRYSQRDTVCVSTQVGCAMGCGFCATGQAGFFRQLSSGEIIEQVFIASRRLRALGANQRVSNVVFMGMGEPLANFTALIRAIDLMNREFAIGARSFTVSTVGIAPGIRRLAEVPIQVNLAVSLHAANDALRSSLLPINKSYPISVLMEAINDYRIATNRRVSFEWALMDSVNDSDQDAKELAGLALEVGAHINLIPLNSTPGWPASGSSLVRVHEFANLLESLGCNVTIRSTRGAEIAAACGQLANRKHVVGKARRLPGSVTAFSDLSVPK